MDTDNLANIEGRTFMRHTNFASFTDHFRDVFSLLYCCRDQSFELV